MMNNNEEYYQDYQDYLDSMYAFFLAAAEFNAKQYRETIKNLFYGVLYMGREVAVDLEAVICHRRLMTGRRGSRS
jgi:hypothetical protein